jgi:flavin reductase (DIM6/NTAB) family NADH-FMN oxidoreductase RutF
MEQKRFDEISPLQLKNSMEMIGSDWMLITAWDEEQQRVNAMTASWGCMGVLWNKNICVLFVRPQRHTYGLLEASERCSLAFFGQEHRDALRLCGSKSGRDMDKIEAAGLTSMTLDGVSVIAEAETLILCRKLYADDLKNTNFLDPALLANYKNDDFHRIYVCEIEKAYVKIAE